MPILGGLAYSHPSFLNGYGVSYILLFSVISCSILMIFNDNASPEFLLIFFLLGHKLNTQLQYEPKIQPGQNNATQVGIKN